MNGNFETDRGSYPFNGIRVGDSYRIVYVPNLDQLSKVPLTATVAAGTALRLNTAYHAGKAGGPKPDFTSANIRKIIGEEVTSAVQRGDLDGARATQIQQLLDAEV